MIANHLDGVRRSVTVMIGDWLDATVPLSDKVPTTRQSTDASVLH